jgi:OFA family oxalate/formate antiporter-like MFS transporter
MTVTPTNRWTQLAIGVVCMILIANLQYGWTNFVQPMSKAHGWTEAGIQFALTTFVALETWLTPLEGWIAETLGAQRGPKLVIAAGGILVALGWVINAYAETLWVLWLGSAVAGIGAGGIYAVCVGNAVKWFPDRRGLAVGITAAGFGGGAAVSVKPIIDMIQSQGYAATFFWFGLGQGALIFAVAWLLRAPLPGEVPSAVNVVRVTQSARSFTPLEVLKTPTFWVLYLMFVTVSASGLMATAQVALVATSFGLGKTVLIFGWSTIVVAQIVDNVLNGAARPFFGWVSDRIGRESTMAIAFSIGGAAYWLVGMYGASPWAFVLLFGLIFFTWGEIFSLFPSTCTDTFGPKHATVNTSLLYTAKGASVFLVPLANIVKDMTGSWHFVFVVTGIANLVVVAVALFVLRPMRARHQASANREIAHAQAALQ